MNRPPPDVGIAAVILTLNEAAVLPRCLAAIPAAMPVVIVDSGSTDETLAIARARGCHILQRVWSGFADQRNFALEQLADPIDWVVFIDADEVFPDAIWSWTRENLTPGQAAQVIYLSQRIHIGGAMLRYAPHYPIFHPRIVRRSPGLFLSNQSGHGETVRDDLSVAYVDIPYDHHIIEDRLDPWLKKHVDLAQIEARRGQASVGGVKTRRARLNAVMPVGPLRALARFIFHYGLIGGWRDGRAGFVYCALYGWYELTKWVSALRVGPAAPDQRPPGKGSTP